MCFSNFFNFKGPSELATLIVMSSSEDYPGIFELQIKNTNFCFLHSVKLIKTYHTNDEINSNPLSKLRYAASFLLHCLNC